MQELQEAFHADDHDYRAASPHLRHWRLYDWLVGVIRESVGSLADRGLPPTVLEIGGGHGGYTETALALGCKVVATEMSRPSIDHLNKTFGVNPNFSAVFDVDGTLEALGDGRFSLIICSSVLHHIPEYVPFVVAAVNKRLLAGGTFLSFQDPLWYPRASSWGRALDRTAYYSWRLTRGSYGRGLATLLRRSRHTYDESNPADMVEYHVVRQGVDEQALRRALMPLFDDVDIHEYWSVHASLFQRIGSTLGATNTFLLRATRFRGD